MASTLCTEAQRKETVDAIGRFLTSLKRDTGVDGKRITLGVDPADAVEAGERDDDLASGWDLPPDKPGIPPLRHDRCACFAGERQYMRDLANRGGLEHER